MQGRDHAQLEYLQTGLGRHLEAIQVKLLYQRPFENITRRASADLLTRRFQRDEVQSVIPSIQLTSPFGARHLLTYGAEGALDQVSSGRTDLALSTGARSTRNGTYPNGSNFRSISFYLQDEMQLERRLSVVLGARQDRILIHSLVSDPLVGSLHVDGHAQALTGSGHLLFAAHRHVSFFGGVAQGFRAPNIDGSSILGGGSRFDVPNGALRPEHSFNVESGVRFQGKRGQASATFFGDSYRDLIDRAPGLLGGLAFVDVNGNGRKEVSEPEVWQRQNVRRAKVKGVEVEGVAHLSDRWTWSNSLTWTRGTDTTLGTPLTRIPPLNGNSRLTWEPRRWLWVEAVALAATGQQRLAPADKSDTRIGPAGTPGYLVFHLRAGFRGSFLPGFSVALENVTNRRYRFHGSGFDRPGLNLVAGFNRSF